MSITLKEYSRIDIFPQELLQHLARRFNGVVQTNVLVVKSNRFEILFKKFPGASEPVFVNLFTKIVLAMNSIKKKYLTHEAHNIHISVKLDNNNIEHYRLIISGANKIPPGKLFNLFPLILWYHIKYQTGEKPSSTVKGQGIT